VLGASLSYSSAVSVPRFVSNVAVLVMEVGAERER
jgi:hypothetical protein